MDRKLLDALNNIGVALEMLTETLTNSKEKSKTATGQALQNSNLGDKIKELNLSIKNIQKDTKEILKNQKSIISMLGKSKSDKSDEVGSLSSDPKKKQSIKDGVGMILMIATGVLAIGLAFSIIGKVDFASVIALSIALPLVAIAFEKIAKIGSLKPKDMAGIVIITIAIAGAITVSSYILSKIQPVGIFQLFTAVFIAGVFAVISHSIGKLITGINSSGLTLFGVAKIALFLPIVLIAVSAAIMGSSYLLSLIRPVGIFQIFTAVFIAGMFAVVSYGIGRLITGINKAGLSLFGIAKVAIFLPIVMIAISAGIAGSSYLLSNVQPVGIFQLFTAVFIAAAFGVISFGLGKLLQGIKKVGTIKEAATIALLLPIVLVGIAAAITASSYLLANIQPIGLFQFFTAVMIAIIFIPISFALPYMAKAMEKISIGRMLLLPAMMVLIAGAIWLTSKIFAKVERIDPGMLFNILLQAITLSLVSIAFGAVIWAFDKFKLTLDKLIMGGIGLVVIAGTILATSYILSLGDYSKYPSFGWVASVSMSLVTFGLAAVVLGTIAMSGIGALAILAGAVAVLAVAGTIVATAEILGMGKYGIFPSISWSTSVALSMGAFGAGIILLGGLVVGTLGLGGLAIAAGAKAVRVVAQSIVDTSLILQKGKFSGGPGIAWARGISMTLGAFSPIYGMLLRNSIFELFGGGGVGPEDFRRAIITISRGIVEAANMFNKSSVSFTGGPKKEWSEGVGKAISAFAPVYEALNKNSHWYSSGPSVEDMAKAIVTISSGVVTAATIFNKASVAFSGGPKKEWAEGVGKAISAFAPVYEALNANSHWWSSGPSVEEMAKAIEAISSGIVAAAKTFNSASVAFSGGPKKEWAEGIGGAINAFAPVYEVLSKSSGWFSKGISIDSMSKAIKTISQGIVTSATYFNSVKFTGGPRKEWVEGVGGAIKTFAPVFDYISKNSGFFTSGDEVVKSMQKGITSIAQSIVDVSLILNRGKFGTRIDPAFIQNINDSIKKYIAIIDYLADKDTDDFDLLDEYAEGLVDIADAYGEFAKSISKLNNALGSLDMEKIGALKTLTGGIILMSLMDADQFSDMMDELEDKADIFVETINKLEGTEPGKAEKSTPTVNPAGTVVKAGATSAKEDKMDKVLALLSQMNSNLGSIASDARSIQDQLLESQTENTLSKNFR